MKRIALSLLSFYQKKISVHFQRRCRYEPTCSNYAIQAIKVHGVFKGLLLAAWRLLKCNPLSAGGVNHVPEKGKWKSKTLNHKELLAFYKEQDMSSSDV